MANVARDFHLVNARKKRIIVCEDLNFFWDEPELKTMIRMWEVGISISGIAQHFKRDPDEILIALIHLARKKKIGSRQGGLEGEFGSEFTKAVSNAKSFG